MNTSNSQFWRMIRSLFLVGAGSVLLASCSNLGYSSGANSESQNTSTSDPEALAAEFNFPLTSCGEQATEPSGTWYVVYIDGANPDEVRREYCRDAIGTVRDDTGAPTVQVASLTDYSKALKLATAVGGEVETTVVDRTSPSPTGVNGANGINGSNNNAQTNPSDPAADMGALTATDPGSLINIRDRASTSAGIQHTGRSGDRVRISEQQQGDDGRTWYKVVLESGPEGWVRSDFVTRQTASGGTTNTTANGTTSSFNSNISQSSSSTTTANSANQSNNSTETTSDLRYTTGSTGNNGGYNATSGDTTDHDAASASANRSSSDSTQTASSSYSTESEVEDSSPSNSLDEEEDYTAEDEAEEESIAADGYATLRSENPGARINVRDDASTASDIQDIGYAGDSVQVIDTVEGDDGYTWYQVELETGAVGWVRGDLLNGV
jgi:hypothetical protein